MKPNQEFMEGGKLIFTMYADGILFENTSVGFISFESIKLIEADYKYCRNTCPFDNYDGSCKLFGGGLNNQDLQERHPLCISAWSSNKLNVTENYVNNHWSAEERNEGEK